LSIPATAYPVRGRARDIRRTIPEWELVRILACRAQPAVGY